MTATDSTDIRPFRLHIADAALADLHDRLDRTRWTDDSPPLGWNAGVPVGYLKELAGYWRSGFDWRAQEAELNSGRPVLSRRPAGGRRRRPEESAFLRLLARQARARHRSLGWSRNIRRATRRCLRRVCHRPGRQHCSGRGLRTLGADQVVVDLSEVAPVDLVIDMVGGSVMTDAWALLRPGGSLESVGWASSEPAVFAPCSTVGPIKSLRSYLTVPPVGEDLRDLVRLMTAGKLSVQVGWQGDWGRIEEAAAALRKRWLQGKAILDLHGHAT